MPDSESNPELHGLDPGELLARAMQTARPSPGAGAWMPPTPEEVARLLPQYRIESLIGRGGMGAVYKGVQLTLDRVVAIKLLPAEIAADAQFVARFQREARTLARLQHSRIVTIHDSGQTSEGHLYFVMEYIDGTDLRSILRGPGLDPEQALVVVGQLCDALQAAHREGIVHRDIKPENVLVTHDGYVKLADFGLARPPQEADTPDLTNTNVVMGTPDYMAPEQRFGAAKADHRSDIFALGVMFYEMLTGQTPRGVFDPPSHKAQMDVRIDEVVLRALQSEPDRRYQKVTEMKTDVDRIRSTPPAGVPKAATPPPRQPRHVLARAPGLVVGAVIGGLLVIIAFLIWNKDTRTVPARTVEGQPALGSSETPAPAPATPIITAMPVKAEPPQMATTPLPASPPPVAIVAPKPATPPRVDPTPAPTPVPVPAATPAPPAAVVRQATPVPTTPTITVPPSQIEILKQQGPNISAWVTSPLDTVVPDAIWQNLTFMKEELRDEVARKPAASTAAYGSALRLCALMLDDLAARKVAQTEAGGAAALRQTSQLTEWRRDHLTWPMYSLEHDERSERKEWAGKNSARMVAWSKRTNDMRYELGVWYNKFREALRQNSAPTQAPR
jgi:serine/threonine protein kinase